MKLGGSEPHGRQRAKIRREIQRRNLGNFLDIESKKLRENENTERAFVSHLKEIEQFSHG
jgi:hypothetical protein